MKRSASLSFALVALFSGSLRLEAATPYFPYDTIEKYYGSEQQQPAPPQPPAPQQQAPPASARPKGGPAAIGSAPEFLFPAKLGFGVAVGVPYDMMYFDKEYYLWQGGVWYRSYSYRGPWTELSYAQLAPELRKHPLAKIRGERNKEFKAYWKDREGYQGRRFRPGGEVKGESATQ